MYIHNTMHYEEFAHLTSKIDKDNPYTPMYILPSGETFFVEPAFYTQLTYLKGIYPDKYRTIIEEMEIIVKNGKHVIFCHDFEHPLIKKDGYILLEIEDVTNRLGIYPEDKSRGSDYGD